MLTVDTVAPAVTIAGGANALTNDATPDISGTADVAAGTTVTVTLADETLTALVQAGGAWSVTAAALSDGPHRVVVSVSDAAGNPAGATQTLTVDTVSPVVAITGGDDCDDERPRPDHRRDLRRRARHDRHRVDRGPDDDDARAGQRHLERDADPRRRRHVAGRRLGSRSRRQRGERAQTLTIARLAHPMPAPPSRRRWRSTAARRPGRRSPATPSRRSRARRCRSPRR